MSILSSLHAATPPPVAVELAANRVSAAAIEFRGGKAVVSAHASEPLPDGALVPSLTGTNLHDRAAIIGALGRVFDRLGGRPRRIGLVIPDPVAKVSLVRFEQVPARRQDLDQLVRWQVRKAAPFPIEEAQVSYTPGIRGADGQEFVVISARRDIDPRIRGGLFRARFAPGHRRSGDLQRRQCRARGIDAARGRLAAGQRHRGLRVDRDSARCST